jgi:hypothetical protein
MKDAFPVPVLKYCSVFCDFFIDKLLLVAHWVKQFFDFRTTITP